MGWGEGADGMPIWEGVPLGDAPARRESVADGVPVAEKPGVGLRVELGERVRSC
jgi:hypothetical protein